MLKMLKENIRILIAVTFILQIIINAMTCNISAEGVQQGIIGDFIEDGKVDSTDYASMKKHILFYFEDTSESLLWRGDVNNDGYINSIDLAFLKKFILGIINKFPKEQTLPEILMVDEIKIDNYKEVVVKFNKIIDNNSVMDTLNYIVTTESGVNSIELISLEDDKRTVVITMKDCFMQGQAVEVRVKKDTGISSDIVKNITAIDCNLPVAKELIITGDNIFAIKFSEPINLVRVGLALPNEILINESSEEILSKEISHNGKILYVKTKTNLVDINIISVKVNRFCDYAGFNILQKMFYPQGLKVIEGNAINNKEIVVKFNKPLDNRDIASNTLFYEVRDMKNSVIIATPSEDLKSVRLSLNNALTSGEKVTLILEKELGFNTDLEKEIMGVIDNKKPYAELIKQTRINSFQIVFSEPVYGVSSEIVINGSSNVLAGELSPDGRILNVTSKENTISNGVYYIELKGYMDYGNNVLEDKVLELEIINDETVLYISNVKIDNYKEINVEFNKEIENLESVFDLKNYTVTVNNIIKEVDLVTLSDNKKVVTLNLKDPLSFFESVNIEVNKTLGLMRNTKKEVKQVIDSSLPYVEEGKVRDSRTIEILFSEPMQNVQGSIEINNGDLKVVGEEWSRNGKILFIKMDSDLIKGISYNLTVSGYRDYSGFSILKKTVDVVF